MLPCDFWLFPTLKRELRGRNFSTDQQVTTACQTIFRALPEDEFRKTFFEKWPERMKKCIESNGAYFEKRPNVNVEMKIECNKFYEILYSIFLVGVRRHASTQTIAVNVFFNRFCSFWSLSVANRPTFMTSFRNHRYMALVRCTDNSLSCFGATFVYR